MLSLELQNREELELLRQMSRVWISLYNGSEQLEMGTRLNQRITALLRELDREQARQEQPVIEGIVDLRIGDLVRHQHEDEFTAHGYVRGITPRGKALKVNVPRHGEKRWLVEHVRHGEGPREGFLIERELVEESSSEV